MTSRFLSLADVQEMLNISSTQAYSLVRSFPGHAGRVASDGANQ